MKTRAPNTYQSLIYVSYVYSAESLNNHKIPMHLFTFVRLETRALMKVKNGLMLATFFLSSCIVAEHLEVAHMELGLRVEAMCYMANGRASSPGLQSPFATQAGRPGPSSGMNSSI